MPLTPFQRMVVDVLRPFRDKHNYIAGGAALNHDWPRLSDDMDIFYDLRDQLPDGVEPELEALREAGFSIEPTTEDEWMVEVILRQYGFETKVQWLDEPETSRRFFPAQDDNELGFRLHQADVAVNKVLCASRRQRAARDTVDLVYIYRNYSPLGPLIWAAAGKDTNVSPVQMIGEIRRIAFGYAEEEIATVRMVDGNEVSRSEVRSELSDALEGAMDYCEEIAPIDYMGYLFVDAAETPKEASDEAVASGEVTALPLQDFTAVPTIS